MSCGIGHRCGLHLALLWPWCRPVATALIRLLAWKSSYAMSVALEKTKDKKKKKKKEKINAICSNMDVTRDSHTK